MTTPVGELGGVPPVCSPPTSLRQARVRVPPTRYTPAANIQARHPRKQASLPQPGPGPSAPPQKRHCGWGRLTYSVPVPKCRSTSFPTPRIVTVNINSLSYYATCSVGVERKLAVIAYLQLLAGSCDILAVQETGLQPGKSTNTALTQAFPGSA